MGIDVGTSLCKAVLFDGAGRQLAAGQAATPWRAVPTGAEMDAGSLLETVMAAVRSALDRHPDGGVAAVGVTSMAETGVLMDRRGDPVAPMIAWFDSRGENEARALGADLPWFTASTGLQPGPTPSIAKHRWLLDHHEPAAAGRRWLNVAEWVVHALGGEDVAELSLASRTGYLHLRRIAWWPDALSWVGLPRDLFPQPSPAGTPAGRCRVGPERIRGARLAVGGHDHPCAAVGAGVVGTAEVLSSMGTAHAILRALVPPVPGPVVDAAAAAGLSIGWHAIDAWQLVMAGCPFGKVLEEHPDQLDALVARIAGYLRAMDELFGPHDRVVAVGGWTRRREVLEAERRALGELEAMPELEAGCWGAAMLAGRATGVME
jgi:sugar (pentulose or hexulose) kinase